MNSIKSVTIIGGGTSGWMTAAALIRTFPNQLDITLVESDAIGTVGVGEATIPQIKLFLQMLGLPEKEFIEQTQGTFKLGIEFVDWGKKGDRYMHAFGPIGQPVGTLDFYQYWLKNKKEGSADSLWDYSLNFQAAHSNQFSHSSSDNQDPLQSLAYAYHFDAAGFARYLRAYAEHFGVKRIEGKVTDVEVNQHSGDIDAVQLESGKKVSGDLFIDCSGFRSLLIEQTLKSGFEDWSKWLPCDRAVAIPCKSSGTLLPYTRATALDSGWQWRIPLQSRIGNGYVYCSDYIDSETAEQQLINNLDGKPLAEPNHLRFTAGMRKKIWVKNCIAIGLSSGFLEPLESTSIHLVQFAIGKLIEFFPSLPVSSVDRAEYNRQINVEYTRIRDFIILHYHLNQRADSDFWLYCQNMELPDTLKEKIELFQHQGRIVRRDNELFTEVGWLQVFVGQNLLPKEYSPLANRVTKEQIQELKQGIRSKIDARLTGMPNHFEYLKSWLQKNE